jgi:hypothetical protein
LLKQLQSLAIEIAIKGVIADCNCQLPHQPEIAIDFELFLAEHSSSFWCDGQQ